MLPLTECSGCSACIHACPKACISAVADNHGFLYPQINNELCVKCGLCEKICPVLNTVQEGSIEKEVTSYAVKATDNLLRKNSSSGGFFSVIAQKTLENNGTVYGAAFDKNFEVEHIGITSSDSLNLLRRSKYVQSNLNNCFISVEKDLKNEKNVLFSGTPCQVEGLLSFLKKPYNNLVTVDFVCHGVPSPKIWKYYKGYLEKKYNSTITNVNFRDKSSGWKNYSLRVEFKNGKVYHTPFGQDPYMKAFLSNLDLRESCYNCKFKSLHRKSDITVADYWGIDKIAPETDDDKGLSLVLINTDKGKNLFTELEADLELTKAEIEKVLPYNPCITTSVKRHNFKQYFLNNYAKGDFAKTVDDCLNPSYTTRLKRKILHFKNGDT